MASVIVNPGVEAPPSLPKGNEIIQWIEKSSNPIAFILSVFRGAFGTSAGGFLNNSKATSYAPMINPIVRYTPDTKPVYYKR